MATLRELADLVGGQIVGDENVQVNRVAPLSVAGPGDITFVSSPKYLAGLRDSKATAVILFPGVESSGQPAIVCKNPYLAFAKILTHLQVRRPEPMGIMEGAWVAADAQVAEGVTIHPGCVVGQRVRIGRGTILYPNVVVYDDVSIGADCTVHSGVVIREGCRLGDRVILQPSALIGGDGFGFAPDDERYYKIPQVGIVEIEDDVEIGAASCVDRAALGVTRICRGVKIDNLVQVAHNVVVGENTILVSQSGIAGSSTIGRHCTFGGQSAIAGHLKVGDNVTIAGRGGVTHNVESNQVLSGLPAIPHKEWLKAAMSFSKLPDLRKEVNRLKRQVEELESMIKES